MVQMSILDKLGIFIHVFLTSKLPFLFLILGFIIYYCKKIRKKVNQKEVFITYGIFSIIIFLLYHSQIFSAFDYIMTNFLTGYYFPDLALYFFILFMSHLVFLSIYFRINWTEKMKKLWIIQFIFSETNFLLFLYLTAKNKLEISNSLSLYQDKNILTLLELETLFAIVVIIIFIFLWILEKDKMRSIKIVKEEVKELPKPVVQTEIVYRDKDHSVLQEELKNLQTTFDEEHLVGIHELRMLKIKQKKDLLKIYKKMIELQIHIHKNEEVDEDFDAIESIIDDSEINTDQNFHQYISELEQRHQNHMNTMNDVIRNNF